MSRIDNLIKYWKQDTVALFLLEKIVEKMREQKRNLNSKEQRRITGFNVKKYLDKYVDNNFIECVAEINDDIAEEIN